MKILVKLIFAIILMTSCNSKESKSIDSSLLQSDWKLEKINGELLNDSMPIPMLQIDISKMQLSGNAGCNTYTGSISELKEEEIVFGNIAATLKMCAEENYEDQFLELLNQVKTFTVTDTNLSFTNSDKKVILEFGKYSGTKTSMRIHDIWNVVRVNGNPINRMVTVPRLEINTSEMKIYGNDGCNEYFGPIRELSEENIALGNIGSTRKMCPEMEFPQRYMTALKQIKHYKFENNMLVVSDSEGQELVAFIKGD